MFRHPIIYAPSAAATDELCIERGGLCRWRFHLAWTLVSARILLIMTLIGVAFDFFAFDSYGVPADAEVRRAAAAVVFTGTFERVDAGLRLLDARAVPWLYVSGVNANAGIPPARFVSLFSLRNPSIADLPRLIACCIEWGERADSTFQNALDTKCWVDRRRVSGPLLLITSRRHMARALAGLSGALPGRALIPYPVDDAPHSAAEDLREQAVEYAKYLGARIAMRLPRIVRPKRLDPAIAQMCPTMPRRSGPLAYARQSR